MTTNWNPALTNTRPATTEDFQRMSDRLTSNKPFQVACRNKDYYAHHARLELAIRDAEYEFAKTGYRERYIITDLEGDDTNRVLYDTILTKFRREYPGATGQQVQEGHAGACRIWGHADYIVDGVLQMTCARCGENKCHADHEFDCGV